MNIEYKLANIVINIASKYNLPYNKIYTLLYNEFIIKREVIDILENEIIYFMDNYERSFKMKNKIKNFWSNLKYLFTKDLRKERDKDIDFLKSEIQRYNSSTLRSVNNLREDIDKCFNIDIDIPQKETLTIIVSGVYKGRDYVKIYKLNSKDFISFVDDLKQREEFGNIHIIDSFDRSVKRELECQWEF